ncbi:hypothetical protein [Streptodolium elevatio]
MTRAGHTVWASFSPGGAFRYGGAGGPDAVALPLRMCEVLEVLEAPVASMPPPT